MSKSTDRILAAIDAGLQTTTEASYGERGAGVRRCVRCRNEALEDGEFCEACRAFILGDLDRDPLTTGATSAEDAVFVWYREQLAGGHVTIGGTRVPDSGDARSFGLTRRGAEMLRENAIEWYDRTVDDPPSISELIETYIAGFFDGVDDAGVVLTDGPRIEFDDESRGMILYGHGFRLVEADGTVTPLDGGGVTVRIIPLD